MGFRSTLVSEVYGYNLPEWFKDKYKEVLDYVDGITLIRSSGEFKIYWHPELFDDYRKALIECGRLTSNSQDVVVAVLAEDGRITKVAITRYDIQYLQYQDDEGLKSDGCWNP